MAEGPATQPPGSAASPGDASARPARFAVEHLGSVDSTNRWLLDAARAGADAGLVAVADHQAAGRGRRGRTWESAPGESLLVSVLLRPTLPVERVHVVTIAAALGLCDALDRVAGLTPALKWPNDLLVGERKLAGLLAEADVVAGDVRAIVVGAGCNLAQRAFPDELAAVATSCAIATGSAPDRDAVLGAFLECLGARLDDVSASLDDYRDRLATLGRDVRVDLERGPMTGRATDVDELGRLVVATPNGERVVVAAGDVVHLRPDPPRGRAG